MNVEESSLLSVNKPTIAEQYIPVTNFKVIPLTLNEEIMKMSFSEEYALANFMGYLMSLMQTTKDLALYKDVSTTICTALAESATTGMKTITVDGFASESSDDATTDLAKRTANAKALYRAIIGQITEVQIGSYENGLGDIIYNTPSNLVCLIPSQVLASLDVDALATLLNSSVITSRVQIELIPWDFGNHKLASQSAVADTTCFLLDKEAVQYGFKYQLSTSFFDASNLNQNYWTHYSYYSAFVNGAFAVAINVNNMYTA